MAEFRSNTNESSTSKSNHFFGNYGFHSRITHSVPPVDRLPQSLDAKAFAKIMNQFPDFLRTNMRTFQSHYNDSTNQSRTPALAFQVADKVFPSAKNIRTNRISRKFDWKRPFPIKKVISAYAYKLDLPSDIKLHPVFLVSLLDPAPSNPIPDEVIPPPLPVIVDNNLEYKID